jgi:hypothetical protein
MKINATLMGGERPLLFSLSGRLGQTLNRLYEAGAQGITPLETPALRLAAHVHDLRKIGFLIETEREPHAGAYSGFHARYRLCSDVSIKLCEREVTQ